MFTTHRKDLIYCFFALFFLSFFVQATVELHVNEPRYCSIGVQVKRMLALCRTHTYVCLMCDNELMKLEENEDALTKVI